MRTSNHHRRRIGTSSSSSLTSLTMTIWLLLVVWYTNQAAVVVTACSCLGPITFHNALLRDEMSTAAKIRIRNEIFPNGPLDPVGNGMRYFRATILRPYRGCQFVRGQSILVSTGGNSALCGIDITTRTDYLLFGFQQQEIIKGLGTRTVLQVGSCSYNVPFSLVTKEQQGQLNKFKYVDNCRPEPCDNDTKCGPMPPVAPPRECPNGSTTFYDITCVKVAPTSTKCRWNIKSSNCPACSEDADCTFSDYCSAGLCRTKGTCEVTADCWNPSSQVDAGDTPPGSSKPYPSPSACVAEVRECNGRTCESTCCPKNDVVACFADPCDVLTTTPPFHTCVSDFCGGCNAYAFDKAGNLLD